MASNRLAIVTFLLLFMTACSSSGDPESGSNETLEAGDNANAASGNNVIAGPLPDLAPHAAAFKSKHYSGSAQCSVCHDRLSDEAGNDVSIAQSWSSSMMANATRDPYWIAKVAAEIDRHPALENMLADTCSRCHAPMANDSAKKDNINISLFGENSLLSPSSPLFDHAMEGVSCTLCHQLEDNADFGTDQGTSGNFSIAEFAQPSDRPAYGQYTDPSSSFMRSQTQFNPVYGEHMKKSAACASCHDLKTSHADANGTLSNNSPGSGFPEQMVFSEWQNSDYQTGGINEATCQSCHMPVASGSIMLSSRGGGVPRTGFSQHTFLGANTVMQTILRDYSRELGISVEAAQFDASISRNRAFLQGAASIKIVSSTLTGQQLNANVLIRNQAGHKLPSGYPSRRVYLHFKVSDSNGNVVFESGKAAANGSINGNIEDTDNSQYENHYDVITSGDQVQIYEAIMGDTESGVTHTLMRASHYLKDNRLLPAGFDKISAPDDIKVAGLASNDSNFDAGGDQVSYRVTVPVSGSYTVLAELIYQPLAYGHLQDLFSSDHLLEVNQFKTLFNATTLKAETIAIDSATVHRE